MHITGPPKCETKVRLTVLYYGGLAISRNKVISK